MAQPPKLVNIGLQDFLLLLNYYWSSVNGSLGDLGSKTYEETVIDIDRQSSIKLTPQQLESLVFHTKEAIFEKIKPRFIDLRLKNYHPLMRRLSDQIPNLFKTLPSGEIVFVNFEDKEYV